MSVTIRLGDAGTRLNLYYKVPAQIMSYYVGYANTTSTSFTKKLSGTINIPVNNNVVSFYNYLVINYSFIVSANSSSVTGYAYLVFNGQQTSTYSGSGGSSTNVNDSISIPMPSDGVLNWELWMKTSSSSYAAYVSQLTFILKFYSTNSSVTASQFNVGQFFIIGYTLYPNAAFYIDDDTFYLFANTTSSQVTEVFDIPVKCNKITFFTEPAIVYLIVI